MDLTLQHTNRAVLVEGPEITIGLVGRQPRVVKRHGDEQRFPTPAVDADVLASSLAKQAPGCLSLGFADLRSTASRS